MSKESVKKPFKQPIIILWGDVKALKVKSTLVVGEDVFESSEPEIIKPEKEIEVRR